MRFATALLTATLLLADGQANGQVQLLPAGEFAARDGRPGKNLKWSLTDEQGHAVAAAMNATIAATPIVIDYEHQTLLARTNGQAAPAAGWMRRVSWLTGKGLMAEVDWTERAAAAIKAREYLYISPVITHDPATGQVTGVHMAALTNYPALLGMDAAAALSALTDPPEPKEPPMKQLLTALAAALAMPHLATADEATAVAALQAWKPQQAKPQVPVALTTLLGLQAGADEAAALAAIAKLQAPDATTAQTIAALTAQLNTLTAQINGDKVARDVDAAINAGKLTPAQRDVYLKIGATNYELLTATLASLQAIPGLAGQNAATKAAGAGSEGQPVTALTADQSLIAQQLGIAPADYLKQLQQAA